MAKVPLAGGANAAGSKRVTFVCSICDQAGSCRGSGADSSRWRCWAGRGPPSRAVCPVCEPSATEVRALWVTRSSLTTPAGIAALVRTAREQGFNTLLVQVRGRADAYYTTDLEPRSADLARQPGSFDPLAAVLSEAKAGGIRVHAWVNVNLVSSAVELPAAPDHLVYRHPEWLMVPRVIAQEVARLDPANPAYMGKIARWTRGQLETVEGLYASPLQPDAAAHIERVLVDLARRYALDGVHLDYSRYPNQQFDYSRFAIAAFRADIRPRLGADARRRARRGSRERSLRVSRSPAGRVEGVPARPSHRPRRPHQPQRAHRASGRARDLGRRRGFPGRVQREDAGLARLARRDV